jgi:hypothetical protein
MPRSSSHQGPRQLQDHLVPRGPGSRLLAQVSFGTVTCPQGSISCLLTQDSSEATTCPGAGVTGYETLK